VVEGAEPSRQTLATHPLDLREHSRQGQIIQHFSRREPQHLDSLPSQPPIPPQIMDRLIGMGVALAIDLNGQPR